MIYFREILIKFLTANIFCKNYICFYFQAVQDKSAQRNNVDFLSLAIFQIVVTVCADALAIKTEYYVSI